MLNFSFKLIDTYGDGWNGANVTLLLNGENIFTNVTVSVEQQNENIMFFSAENGDVITLNWIPGTYISRVILFKSNGCKTKANIERRN